MVTVEDVYVVSGYSRHDHLIDNGPARTIIGRRYRSAHEALRAAAKAARPGNPNASPVAAELRLDSGAVKVVRNWE